ncbi:MAG: Lrp/AsnC ligand binding domain-containing protein [Nitrososphaera sp.]
MPVAIMLIDCSIGTDDVVIDRLKKIPAVAYAYKLIGYHDIILKVESNSAEELRKTISHKIRTLDNILSTITMVVLEK